MLATKVFDSIKALTPTISVGVITADLMNLGSQLALLEQSGVGLLHFDVMDGCFCPSMTMGSPFIKAVKTPLIKDVHLMISEPLTKIADYVAAGADMITVHIESEPTHIHRAFRSLGAMTNANDPERGIVRAAGLNPGTPIEAIEPILDEIEMVLLLAINPGWGGQKFIPSTAERLAQARKLISGRDILLALDGGITRDNIGEVTKLGADIVITGSAVFDGKAPLENAKYMLQGVRGQ